MHLAAGFRSPSSSSSPPIVVPSISDSEKALSEVAVMSFSLTVSGMDNPPFLRHDRNVGGSLLLGWAYATKRATMMGHTKVAAHQVALCLWLVFALVLDGASVAAQVLMARTYNSYKAMCPHDDSDDDGSGIDCVDWAHGDHECTHLVYLV
eukprot:scaffold34050_cov49-Attheya_sp.AAC.1